MMADDHMSVEQAPGEAGRPAGPRRGALDRPIRWRRRLPWIALTPVAVLAQLVAAGAPSLVETAYSRSVYPVIVTILSFLTGWIPFSLAELAVIVAIGWILFVVVRGIVHLVQGRRTFRNLTGHGAAWGLGALGVIYLLGLVLWGFNYHRVTFAETNGLDSSPPSSAELLTLCEILIDDANSLRSAVDEDSSGVMRLADSGRATLARAQRGLEQAAGTYAIAGAAISGRPKPVFFSKVMTYLGISGIYFPFTGEPNVNAEVPDYEFAFTACHEMAHQIGYAFEDEANFIGYLACRAHPDSDFRYSGALKALSYAMNALGREDGKAYVRLYRTCCEGIQRDWRAARAFWRIHHTPIREISVRVNDAYLKSRGQSEGIGSYGRVVDLLIAEQRKRQGGEE